MEPLTGQQVRRAKLPTGDIVRVDRVGLPPPHTTFSAAVFIIPCSLSTEGGGLALCPVERSVFACEMGTSSPLCHPVLCP